MWWLSYIVSNVALALVLALFAWLVQHGLRRPALARILWVMALVKLVTPPLVSVPVGNIPSQWACTLGVCHCGPHESNVTIVRGALPGLMLAIWSAGAVATGCTAWRRWRRFGRLVTLAAPAPTDWQTLASRLSAELSLRRAPELLAVPGRLPPLVVAGWRRPKMLVPSVLIAQLSAAQREALLLHELTHLRRCDHWVRLLELTVSVTYWWLPLVGSLNRQLRDCEEACCDAAVLSRLPDARRDYAQLLLDVLDFTSPLSTHATRPMMQATAMSATQDLERRLRRILDATPSVRRTSSIGALAVGVACILLPCGLHYDFARPPRAAATSPTATPAADTIQWSSGVDTNNFLESLCCPS